MSIRPHVSGSVAVFALGCLGRTTPSAPSTAGAPIASAAGATVCEIPHAEGVPYPAFVHPNYVIEFGHSAVEVDAADGGRIITFSFDGRSVLQSRENSPEAYGSSFWTSPQSDWVWPPPRTMDKDPWKATI